MITAKSLHEQLKTAGLIDSYSRLRRANEYHRWTEYTQQGQVAVQFESYGPRLTEAYIHPLKLQPNLAETEQATARRLMDLFPSAEPDRRENGDVYRLRLQVSPFKAWHWWE